MCNGAFSLVHLVGGAFWDALGTGYFALVCDSTSARDTGVLGARLIILVFGV